MSNIGRNNQGIHQSINVELHQQMSAGDNQWTALMSDDEKMKAARDLYGLDDVTMDDDVQENPQFISDKLRELDEVLDLMTSASMSNGDDDDEQHCDQHKINSGNIYNINTEAYETAVLVNSDYATSDEFRLMFLRSTSFKVNEAAIKTCIYWQRKVEVFGSDCAFRQVYMVLDVKDDDKEVFSKGGVRILPELDDAGRTLLFSCHDYLDSRPDHQLHTARKILWCIVHTALQDPNVGEIVQKNGFVALLCNNHSNAVQQQQHLPHPQVTEALLNDMINALPISVKGVHDFVGSSVRKHPVQYRLAPMGPTLRARYVQHDRVNVEDNLEKLELCGIPSDIILPELGGSLEFDYTSWLQNRLNSEIGLLAKKEQQQRAKSSFHRMH